MKKTIECNFKMYDGLSLKQFTRGQVPLNRQVVEAEKEIAKRVLRKRIFIVISKLKLIHTFFKFISLHFLGYLMLLDRSNKLKFAYKFENVNY